MQKNFNRQGAFSGVPAAIRYCDFSLDGKTVQLASENQDVSYFDVETFKQETDVFSDLKNEKWSTWSSPFGWPVQGIWPQSSNGKDILAVERT